MAHIMWSPLYILVLTLLFYVSCASPDPNKKGIIDEYEGYQCGSLFFPREFLQAATKDAIKKVSGSAPSVQDGGHFLWRLQRKGYKVLTTEISPPACFLVLSLFDMEPVRIIQESSNKYTDCEAKNSTPQTSSSLAITGFRCPDKIFTPEVVEKGLAQVHQRIKNKVWTIQSTPYPVPFDGRSNFGSELLYLWPINTKGTFSNLAHTSIVLNSKGNLVGMVQKKEGNRNPYFKCQPTLSTEIVPQFIDSDFQRQPEGINSDGVDVFECKTGIIKSDLILAAAVGAASGFNKQRLANKRKYPFKVLTSSKKGYENLYEWPVAINGFGSYTHYRAPKGIILLVNDFCNVAGVLEEYRKDKFICKRKIVTQEIYEQLSN